MTNTTDTAQKLRSELGDRLSTSIADLGNGPVFAYTVDGVAYSLEDAAAKFLPAPATAEPEAEAPQWRRISASAVSRALSNAGYATRSDYSAPGIRCARTAREDQVTVTVFASGSGIHARDRREDAETAVALKEVLTKAGYTVVRENADGDVFTVSKAVAPAKRPRARKVAPAPEPTTPEVVTAPEEPQAEDTPEATAAIATLVEELGVAAPTVPALPKVTAPVTVAPRPVTLAEWKTTQTPPTTESSKDLTMRHSNDNDTLTLF